MRTTVLTLAAGVLGLAVVPPAAHAAAATPAARMSPAYEVTVKALDKTITLGGKVVLTGVVRPHAVGEKVKLQQRAGAGTDWHSVSSATIKDGGKYRVTDKPTHATTREYRVVKAADEGHRKGISPVVTVEVYAWTQLTAYTSSGSNYYEDSVYLGAVEYPDSVRTYSSSGTPNQVSYVDYFVSGSCLKVKGTLGLDDRSEALAQVRVDVATESGTLYTHSYALAEHETKTLDVSGAQKVHFTFTSLNDSITIGAVGNPTALCTE